MKKIKLTADSTCDIGPQLIKELDVDIISLTVTLGDEDFKDGKTITPNDIYKFVEANEILPKTAAASPEEYREMFKKYSPDYDAVIHFNISSEMSASNQNAKIAASDFKNVYVIDSRSLSSGTGLLMLKAQELNKEGKKPQEIVEILNGLTDKVQASFVIDTLDYLHKGGRCSGMQKLGAAILRLHPMLLIKDGVITVYKKLRGKLSVVYEEYIEILKTTFPNPDKKVAFITHTEGCSQQSIDDVIEKTKSLYDFDKIYVTVAGSTITSHCGKGTIGLLFINDQKI